MPGEAARARDRVGRQLRGLHRCRDAGQPAACRMTTGRDEHPHPARAPLSRDAGQVGKCTGLKEEVAGETPAQGLPGQCLCEDKQREYPLGQCMPKAPAESQLLCLAVLQAVGHSACIETARRMGVINALEQGPSCGDGSGRANALPISRWALLSCALLLSYSF